MLPSTAERVPLQTADHVNEQIRRQTEENVRRVAAAGPEAIDRRLAELDREWDIERALEANAATAVLAGVTLGAAVHRAFFRAGAVVATTASYQASFDGLAARGIGQAEAARLLRRSVELAEVARAEFADDGRRRFVAASVGPYGAALADGSEYRGGTGAASATWRRGTVDAWTC